MDGRVIRTPDQRLRVFISSTLGELAEERQAARAAIEQLRLAPVMFELGARPHPPRALYRSYMEQSDIFVGIYWQRYGWVAPDMEISGLEDEYVLSAGMPRLIYLKRPAEDMEPRLAELLQQVENESTTSYRPFRDAEELRTLLLDDLVVMLTERFDDAAQDPAGIVPTTNLPAPASAFIGRAQLLADVESLLADSGTRLVTLTGPGGTGKTRLALEAARAAAPRFRDGVFLIDLTEERQARDAYAAMLRSLPIGKTREELPLDALKAALRDRHMLLVLDNFEQVTEAAAGLAELLEACPDIRAVVTSRVALHVRAERRFAVPPMQVAAGPPAPGASDGAASEAVRLFADRASAVDPTFALTDANIRDVAAICARLDGLPLAIELAAARVSLFSVDELRDRLSQHIGVLGRGGSDMPERQQTLRRALDWSKELLDASEQRLFGVCSVFFDSRIVDIEAAVAGLAQNESLDVIEGVGSLVDKSLLHSVSRADGRPRFSMLQTIREYAAEELQADPALAAAARAQHAEHYTALAVRLGAANRTMDRSATLAALASDLLNFRAAWTHWAGHDDVRRMNDLLEPLWGYYEARGNYRAAVDLGEELLAALRRQPESAERMRDEIALEMSLAQSLIAVGGYSAAVERRIEAAIAQSSAAGQAPERFPALRSLATLLMLRAEFARCAAVTPTLLSIAEEQGDAALLSEAHLLEGMSSLWRDGTQQAVAHIDEAVRYSQAGQPTAVRLRVGPDPGVLSHAVSGLMKWLAGFPEQAAVTAARALEIAEEANHPYSLCYALFHTALLDLWQEDLPAVHQRAETLLDRAGAFDYPVWQALGQILHGTSSVALGRPAAGLAEVADGFQLYRGLATPPIFWPALLALRAAANLMAGNAEEALRLVEAGLAVNHDDPTAGDIHVLHGDVLLAGATPDPAGAEACYRRAADIARAAELRMVELQAATRLTNLLRDSPAGEAETRRLGEVFSWFTEGFDLPQLQQAKAALAAV